MTDRRFDARNDRVAHVSSHAPGGRRVVDGSPYSIIDPVADLCQGPGGSRDRQLVFGDGFLGLEDLDGWTFGIAERDGHVGYVPTSGLGPKVKASHVVAALMTHRYAAPEVKAPDVGRLSFGSRVRVVAETDAYCELADGSFAPRPHLRALDAYDADPVAIAERFLNVPYLWGGNSAWGLDCSGLVQAAWMATGQDCPPDSDLQAAQFGSETATDADILRGDLFFWKGHVAIATDPETLIHANAFHMAVVREPIETACARIETREGLKVTVRRRV